MFDIYSEKSNNWFFSGKWDIKENGVITLFLNSIPFNKQIVLITKTDLLPYFKYDIESQKIDARKLKPNVDILEININDIDSIKSVVDWINFKRKLRS